MTILFDSVILLLGIQLQETIKVDKFMNKYINLRNVTCVIKNWRRRKNNENSLNLSIKRMVHPEGECYMVIQTDAHTGFKIAWEGAYDKCCY